MQIDNDSNYILTSIGSDAAIMARGMHSKVRDCLGNE